MNSQKTEEYKRKGRDGDLKKNGEKRQMKNTWIKNMKCNRYVSKTERSVTRRRER